MRSSRLIVAGLFVALLIGAVFAGIYFSKAPESAASIETAEAHLEAGQYAEARDALLTIVAHDDHNAEAYFLLGLAHFNLQSYEPAREAFNRAMELDPERASAVHHNLGALAYQTGDVATALEEFQMALDADPSSADTHYQLGATYLMIAYPLDAPEPDPEMLSRAETEFKQALELAPQNPDAALTGLGNVYLLQGNFAQAVEVLEQVVEHNPQMREALFALGRAYMAIGDVDRAGETLQQFLATDPPAVWAQQAQEMLAMLEE